MLKSTFRLGVVKGYSDALPFLNRWVKSMRIFVPLLTAVLLLMGTPCQLLAAQQKTLELPSGHGIDADIYGGPAQTRILWIAPSHGLHPRHQQMARELGRLGFQVWQVDLAETLFLPRGAQAMRDIPASVVAELITAVSENGKHPLLLVSGAYGAIPVLRGVHAWQASKPPRRFVIGVVLFSPALYTTVPSLGETPQFVEVSSATSIPIYIFQAEKNSNRWHQPDMVKQLQQHAPVYTEIMQGVTSLFYNKDTAAQTLQRLKTLPGRIKKIIPLLRSHAYPLTAIAMQHRGATKNSLGLDDRLKPYRGKLRAQPFSLRDINGRLYTEKDFKGKISIINFWASWCPPCVEEIPSLNRLRKKMQGRPFQLISINYAESAQRIRAFMKKVAVDFPVLVDPQGRTAGRWNVVAFPSTFVIGPDGEIKYGVNAAIHWDTAEVSQLMEHLLAQ